MNIGDTAESVYIGKVKGSEIIQAKEKGIRMDQLQTASERLRLLKSEIKR